jgi:hypothetical protein
MKIKCFPKTMSEEQAMKIARGGGNIVGKMLYGNKDINMRVMYLENRYIVFDMTYCPSIIQRLRKKEGKVKKQKIRVMVEGTRCTASYVDDEIKVDSIDVKEEDIQYSEFTDEQLVEKGKDMCRRMVRRQVGNYITLEVDSMTTVFRPYYIAFYGNLIEGTKVRYLPIPADGNEVKRTT